MLKVFETRREVIRAHIRELEAQLAASPENPNLLLEKFTNENYLTLYTDGVGIQSDDDQAVESWLNDFGATCKEKLKQYPQTPEDVADIGIVLTLRALKSEIDYALWLLACPRREKVVTEQKR